MADPVRFAILDQANDEATPSGSFAALSESRVEIRPRRSVEDIRPCLAELLNQGHRRHFSDGRADAPDLALDEAIHVIADDDKWEPPRAVRVRDRIDTQARANTS